MTSLFFTSCIAPNQDYIWSSVLAYLAEKLLLINFVADLDWPQRYARHWMRVRFRLLRSVARPMCIVIDYQLSDR
ncbi:MAG: hypothetical protein U0175_30690 [Caldilineaceae bacterium]